LSKSRKRFLLFNRWHTSINEGFKLLLLDRIFTIEQCMKVEPSIRSMDNIQVVIKRVDILQVVVVLNGISAGEVELQSHCCFKVGVRVDT